MAVHARHANVCNEQIDLHVRRVFGKPESLGTIGSF
jgi:hypothetical protein